MIYWAPFLHFYQPPIQYHAVLKKICKECYRPLVKTLFEHPGAKVTVNICGVLTELLNDHGAEDVLEGIKQLAENRQLEFAESAKYHAILPLIPQTEMRRQIALNKKANEYFFGDVYKPRGFFPPEMCYSPQMAKVIKDTGYEWILISGIACTGNWPLNFISDIPCGSSTIKIFYRDDILSNKISFQNIDSKGFIKELVNLAGGKDRDIYVITAMDAETFGHHIRHWERLFLAQLYETIDDIEDIHYEEDAKSKRDLAGVHSDIFADLKELPLIEVVTMGELLKKFPARKSRAPKPSSWSTTKEDIRRKNYYPLWKDVDNPVHELQWEHLRICFELVEKAMAQKGTNKEARDFAIFARGTLDRSVFSCQFWWANKKHNKWNVNLINKGLMLQEEAALNAYKAISMSSLGHDIKRDFYHKLAASRVVADKIRDLILA